MFRQEEEEREEEGSVEDNEHGDYGKGTRKRDKSLHSEIRTPKNIMQEENHPENLTRSQEITINLEDRL